MVHWNTIEEERLAITPLDGEWEEVRFRIPLTHGTRGFCRTRISELGQGQGGSTRISSGDLDANGIDDLLQYAFDLKIGNGKLQPYDPERPANKAGIPVATIRYERMSRIVFPIMKNSAGPGVTCRTEQSSDLRQWTRLPASSTAERVLRSSGDWDEVELIIMDSVYQQRFYRICLELSAPLPG